MTCPTIACTYGIRVRRRVAGKHVADEDSVTKYVARAVVGVVPTLLILTFLVSLMVRLIPGTAVDVMLTDSGASRDDRAKLEPSARTRPKYFAPVPGLPCLAEGRLVWTLGLQWPVASIPASASPSAVC